MTMTLDSYSENRSPLSAAVRDRAGEGGHAAVEPAALGTQLEKPATKPWEEAPESGRQAEPDREISLTVPDMHCDGCVETIRANLMMEEGIGGVFGDLKSKKVRVAYSSDQTDPSEIENAISRLGFRVRNDQHEQA